MSSNRDFWESQKPHSKVKTDIVAGYFPAWAKIVSKWSKTLTYLDLFSGRGRYRDGTPSTPIRILDEVLRCRELYSKLHLTFYEKKGPLFDTLQQEVENHAVQEVLTQRAVAIPRTVDSNFANGLRSDDTTFCFIDPYGFKGISLQLLRKVTEGWGSECLFYFSVTGIRRNLHSPKQAADLEAIFGQDGLYQLRSYTSEKKGNLQFHQIACSFLVTALTQNRGLYVLPFAVKPDKRRGVSHYLIFLSKNHRGFGIMKDVMSGRSEKDCDGMPLYRFSGATWNYDLFHEGIRALMDTLLRNFGGRRILVSVLVDECHRAHDLATEKNIKQAITNLIELGTVKVCDPSQKKRKKGTLADDLMVILP